MLKVLEKTENKLLIDSLQKAGATAVLLIGGTIRDSLLGLPNKDLDLEVYGLTIEQIVDAISSLGHVNLVGRSFGVIKFNFFSELEDVKTIDISIPRVDSKGFGNGHKDIVVTGDPYLEFGEALKRRDFTINAMGLNLLNGELIDLYGGKLDMQHKMLRHVDNNTFTDDPLRVLRAMQFAARFNFLIAPETILLARSMDLSGLSEDRIREELFKLLLKSDKPSLGLNYGLQLRVMEQCFPELNAMVGVKQNPLYHPEGDVWTHTCMVVDYAAQLSTAHKLNEQERLTLMLAALLHDLGKPVVKDTEDLPGHDLVGADLAEKFLTKFKVFTMGNYNIQKVVVSLVKTHMRVHSLNDSLNKVTKKGWRNLRKDACGEVKLLTLLNLADRYGKGQNFVAWDKTAETLMDNFESLAPESCLNPVVLGRHLLDLGYVPGKELGAELARLYNLQLEGVFATLEDGLKLVSLV